MVASTSRVVDRDLLAPTAPPSLAPTCFLPPAPNPDPEAPDTDTNSLMKYWRAGAQAPRIRLPHAVSQEQAEAALRLAQRGPPGSALSESVSAPGLWYFCAPRVRAPCQCGGRRELAHQPAHNPRTHTFVRVSPPIRVYIARRADATGEDSDSESSSSD